MRQLSRRDMLRGSVLASAGLPFLQVRNIVDAWRQQECAIPEAAGTGTVVRLSHNENPYGPSELARKAIIDAIGKGNRYPQESIRALQAHIADLEGLTPDQVLITAGSAELLGICGLMAGLERGKMISCHPTFPLLMQFGARLAAQWVKVPLTDDHQYNLAGINAQIDSDTRLVFICNPNNPSGGELPKSMLEPYCRTLSERCMVYVDEAYIELAEYGLKSSLASLTRDNKNVIVGRTFSKIYGMAGLRVGYAIAHPDTISRLRDLCPGSGMTPCVTSVEAAIGSLKDEAFISRCIVLNNETKQAVYDRFSQWGIEYIPSSTNFIFFRTDRFGATNIVDALAQKQIYIRDYSDVPGWARVSMGTMDEIQMFLSATEDLLS